MAEENPWSQHKTFEAGVQSLPEELKQLLGRHEAASLCSSWLKQRHPVESFRDSLGEAVFHWDMVGLAFGKRQRFFEAISAHRELYHQLCEAQQGYGWIHKGLPLVRLRDWHRQLGHPWHEERYLLLTLIEDAVRDKGQIEVEKGGVYHRFRWEDGRTDSEFCELASSAWKTFSDDEDLHEFPEEIMVRLGAGISRVAAAPSEVDSYEINTRYASSLLQRACADEWRALERLAAYELGCIPGFDVEQQKRSDASVFDVFIRIRGNYVDFRRDLGTYMLGECKNWREPVGVATIAYLAQNLAFHQCTAGILFSRSGITGTNENKFAAMTILRAYHHSGQIILVLDQEDFARAAGGESLQEILRKKYEQVRFGLLSV